MLISKDIPVWKIRTTQCQFNRNNIQDIDFTIITHKLLWKTELYCIFQRKHIKAVYISGENIFLK